MNKNETSFSINWNSPEIIQNYLKNQYRILVVLHSASDAKQYLFFDFGLGFETHYLADRSQSSPTNRSQSGGNRISMDIDKQLKPSDC